MDQSQLIQLLSESAPQFSWLLGAGSSQSAGLPTALDVMWDLKRRYYCREENQKITANDVQNVAVQRKISAYMEAQGFPQPGDPREYSACFEIIFGGDYERQRQYLQATLADSRISLSIGHRVMAAMMSAGLARVVFTTNFDTVIEKALAEVAGKSIAPFHLEGSYAANTALNNDEFPLYVKMHGDFRYQSIKNLSEDLLNQDQELGKCLVSSGNRFGLVVAGYSGRDESVMAELGKVLKGPNPFPHGLFWTTMKGRKPLKAVQDLLAQAKSRGVKAELVEIETFDSLMSRVWRQLPNRPPELTASVNKSADLLVDLPMPAVGKSPPLLRLNGLPITAMPEQCFELAFRVNQEWADLRAAERRAKGALICTKESQVWAWGDEQVIRSTFTSVLSDLKPVEFGEHLGDIASHLHLKGFIEQAIATALQRGLPLIRRSDRSGTSLIVDRHAQSTVALEAVRQCVGGFLHGQIGGLMTTPTQEHPVREQVYWAESIRVDLQRISGRHWLVLSPGVWIWPKWARKDAVAFLDRRCGDRFNKKADALLSAWIALLLPGDRRGVDHELTAFNGAVGPGNPRFVINDRTAFSRKPAR
ncbi:SIR2 family protein [Parvibaculum sp.]|jgi:hypothetical protein|uniref:SIR2 family protein n=1 Tax=Parvibaculum sp. TaxID=2024848 RepID=UPI000C6B0506|nr:SIR2 family protein [Parvibaculum sp.]MAM94755.1 SIR2 family protein [Parvibaculum sp.]|tara:strand:- start:8891 stop:10660 length:1770 start_codon:yes stop_codon:yes gene_type:complete